MRYNKVALLLMMLALVWVAAACGGNAGGGDSTEENGNGENPELPVQGEEVTFTELDVSELEADKVVVTYEGGEITGEDMANFLAFQGFISPTSPINEKEFRQEAVKFLVLQRIISPEVTDQEWSKEQVEQLWGNFQVQYDDETRERAFTALKTDEDKLKDSLLLYFLTVDHFRQQVSEEDARAEYEKYVAELTSADVRHILVATHEREQDGSLTEIRPDEEAKQMADDLYKQLQEGADFAELAKEHTDDEGSKENGGLYEGAAVSNWVPEFREATLSQEIGEIGEPVKTDFGYHIIRVEARQTEPFEELSEYFYSELAGEKIDAYYTETLPDKIIEIHL